MSRKHFILIAAAMRLARERMVGYGPDVEATLDEITETLALICSSTNQNFDRDRFLTAANHRGKETDDDGK